MCFMYECHSLKLKHIVTDSYDHPNLLRFENCMVFVNNYVFSFDVKNKYYALLASATNSQFSRISQNNSYITLTITFLFRWYVVILIKHIGVPNSYDILPPRKSIQPIIHHSHNASYLHNENKKMHNGKGARVRKSMMLRAEGI